MTVAFYLARFDVAQSRPLGKMRAILTTLPAARKEPLDSQFSVEGRQGQAHLGR